jgi:formylmethanofuran dehydrogenase subunit C
MEEVVLSYKGLASPIPVEADAIVPDRLREMGRAEIERLVLNHGNERVALADLFTVRGGPSGRIRMEGDLATVKGLGTGMQDGRLLIEGNAGMHVGALMRGGCIEVGGSAGDWAGAEMTGGLLWIRGDAGNRAGSAYRGSKFGMRGGVILIEGGAGHEVGGYMRRGLIAVRGEVQDFAGARMVSGTLLLLGRTGIRTGGGMKRGTIVCEQGTEILPTFRRSEAGHPLFLQVIRRALQARGFPVEIGEGGRSYTRYRGDLAELGKGEILLRRQD